MHKLDAIYLVFIIFYNDGKMDGIRAKKPTTKKKPIEIAWENAITSWLWM